LLYLLTVRRMQTSAVWKPCSRMLSWYLEWNIGTKECHDIKF
jgi:hypothetical protein